jgi:hypothetical protein
LELHAWVNTVRSLGGSEWQVHEYEKHITKTRPHWNRKVIQDGRESYWLDPGLPEVRAYLKDVITEIAIYYSVDGIQLDFIRYPYGGIDDDRSYSLYGENKDRGDWRRENITTLVSIIKQDVKYVNPFIKFGVTPIGIYNNNGSFSGMQGRDDVYQDAYVWLTKNLVDYAAPQIYWNIDDNPKFELVAKDWVNNSSGNNIIIGIGSYKDEIKPEMRRMIDISRNIKANGVAFFRYSSVKNQYSDKFVYKSLPAEMKWKNISIPIKPENFKVSVANTEDNRIILSWNLPEEYIYKYNIKYVALFNLENQSDVLDSRNLFKLVPATSSRISFSINRPSKLSYYYAAKSVDNLWNESEGQTNVVHVTLPRLNTIADRMSWEEKPVLVRSKLSGNYIIIASASEDDITVSGEDFSESIKFARENSIQPGVNIFDLPEGLDGIAKLIIEFRESGRKDMLDLR